MARANIEIYIDLCCNAFPFLLFEKKQESHTESNDILTSATNVINWGMGNNFWSKALSSLLTEKDLNLSN